MERPHGARPAPAAVAFAVLAVVLAAPTAFGADGPPEYRRLFGGDARIAVWVAAQLHLMLGAFVLGVPIFGSVLEAPDLLSA